MALTGMDVEAVRTLGTQMETNAGDIENLVTTLTGQVDGVEWQGPDREQFLADWQAAVANVQQVVSGVRDAGAKARANADAQEQTSTTL